MKNSEVVIGTKYLAKVSGNITVVEILGKEYSNGWRAKNLKTNREVHLKTADCLWHVDTSYQALTGVIIDLTESLFDARNMSYKTEINEDRCEEIFAIRDKLLDTLK